MITAVSSYPLLLRPSLAVLSFLAHSKSPLLNPDTSPPLRLLLKTTFYAQFCAGENLPEVRQTLKTLRDCGYKGAMLAHAKEVVLTATDAESLDDVCEEQAKTSAADIATWERNTLDTIELAQEDDFVAIKFTGAGRQALQHLKAGIACAPAFEEAIHKICKLSEQRGVRLLFDAEQAWLQEGIDDWTLYFMKTYNTKRALVYGTYQAYAKRTPGQLARHLAEAQKHNFALGVKLVRGAYMGSDARELFWNTIEDTHACYNGIAKSLMQRQYAEVLKPVTHGAEFPRVDLVLASHNAQSIALARQLRDEQATKNEPRIEMAYGQLMGMADNVSSELVQISKERRALGDPNVDVPKAYKYLVWGTMGECMKYLLRRAQENKDAVSRTIEARQALGRELARRMGLVKRW